MFLRLFLSLCAGLTFVSASYAAIEDQVSEFMLDNGMQVVVIEDHRAPVVVHMVWYRAGAADEHPGVSGVAQARCSGAYRRSPYGRARRQSYWYVCRRWGYLHHVPS